MSRTDDRRIPELDAVRGTCILGMLLVHFLYDLTQFRHMNILVPQWIQWAGRHGSVLFILLSGVCATLSRNPVRRGTAVLAAALLVSYATLFGELVLGMENIRIWFGILHLLGTSMLLYPLFRDLKPWGRLFLGLCGIWLGHWFSGLTVTVPYLFPLGLSSAEIFTGSDYFPLFPGFGWFLTGTALGTLFYCHRFSLLPGANWNGSILKGLILLGRYSLPIYLLHQPVFLLLLTLL